MLYNLENLFTWKIPVYLEYLVMTVLPISNVTENFSMGLLIEDDINLKNRHKGVFSPAKQAQLAREVFVLTMNQ